MAMRDLLWRCPCCARGSLATTKGGERCGACGTLFRRGRGAEIVARRPDGRSETRSGRAWLDALGEVPPMPGEAGPVAAVLRAARPDMRPVHYDGELIGWVERYGDRVPGTITLTDEAIVFRSDAGDETHIALDALKSIQPSSRTLVLGHGHGAAVTLEFPTSSIMRWEQLLQDAVKRRWRATGRGEVVSYQPRIVAR